MATLARGPAVKAAAAGDKKQQVGRRSRLLSAAVGCFLLFVVFALSSRYNTSFILDDTRRGDFRPSAQGGSSHGAGDGELAQQNYDKAAAAVVPESESVIIREQSNIVKESELEEDAELQSSAATATADAAATDDDDATSNSDDKQAKPAAEDDADTDRDKLRTAGTGTAAQPVVQITSPRHQHPPGDMTRAAAALVNQQRQPLCDLSGSRSDVCDLTGDIRLDANASSFIVVDDDPTPTAAATTNGPTTTTTYKVRPYARKGDATSMSRVTELTVRTTTTADAAAAPRCTVIHAEPAVVFSIGGYAGNLFHDFTDVIVPLYGTAQRFRGDVRLVVTDAAGPWSSRWLAKYDAVLRGLSRHPPLDVAKAAEAGEVHCFGHVVVGLRAHRELMVEPERGNNGPADGVAVVGMVDFARFLRRALSLPRDAVTTRPISSGAGGDVVVDTGRSSRRRRPRLLLVARRGTRRLLNADAVARVAEEVGLDVVVSDLEAAAGTSSDDIAAVARRINSFDAVVGVHGAGLTNMVFLPAGATVVQVVPWGGLQWIARMDFGDPAEAMGLRYVQYEIAVHESSLRDKYPRDHEVFTNPTALHKKGFKFLRHTFLIGQDVTLDVDRFRVVLLQTFQNLTM